MSSAILFEYENILLGKKTGFASYFFQHSPERNENTALSVIKYALETYLRWTPVQSYASFGKETVKLMHLDGLLRFIRFPPEADPATDWFIIIGKIYPGLVKINKKEMTLIIYRKVLNGTLYKFPKGFFDGAPGQTRAIICLRHMLAQHGSFESIEQLYRAFAGSSGTKMLKKYKLSAPCTYLFESPLDFVHEALSEEEQNELFYRYYRFKTVMEAYRREQRASKK